MYLLLLLLIVRLLIMIFNSYTGRFFLLIHIDVLFVVFTVLPVDSFSELLRSMFVVLL